MEYTPLGVGAAVGLGMGIIDRSAASHQSLHPQLLYRGGGLAGSLYAQHRRMFGPNIAPALVTAFAAHFAARAVALVVNNVPLSSFGAVAPATPRASGCACGQH